VKKSEMMRREKKEAAKRMQELEAGGQTPPSEVYEDKAVVTHTEVAR
jgi:hypothetical protein